MFSRFLRDRLQLVRGTKASQPRVIHSNPQGIAKGSALVSYITESLAWRSDHPGFLNHSNYWEAREIVRIFTGLGYAVDAISYLDEDFVPPNPYDIVLDISWNLARLSPLLPATTLKLLHLTGSDPCFQNRAELERIDDLRLRRGGNYAPKRMVPKAEIAREAMQIADRCSLLGNATTLSTFPAEVQKKTVLLPVTASKLNRIRNRGEFVPSQRHFLWFFGSGAVLKGLDRVLEVFLRNPPWTLHVVGEASQETDLMDIYAAALANAPNIHFHGHLAPASRTFAAATRHVFAFVAPSASEGISPATVTCMQYGFFPIVSRNTGVDLPEGAGIWLDSCSIDEIEQSLSLASSLTEDELISQISQTQALALRLYSRESFHKAMTRYIISSLERSTGK